MPITAKAPKGGIVAQLGGESRPLVLRQGEIERFEEQHAPLGVFEMLDLVVSGHPQSRHCRDIVALALVGGGLADKSADKIVSDMPAHENMRIRSLAQDVLFRAFVAPDDLKKKQVEPVGSSVKTAPKATSAAPKSKAQSVPD